MDLFSTWTSGFYPKVRNKFIRLPAANMLVLRTSNFQEATISRLFLDRNTKFFSARQLRNHIELFPPVLDERNRQNKLNAVSMIYFL